MQAFKESQRSCCVEDEGPCRGGRSGRPSCCCVASSPANHLAIFGLRGVCDQLSRARGEQATPQLAALRPGGWRHRESVASVISMPLTPEEAGSKNVELNVQGVKAFERFNLRCRRVGCSGAGVGACQESGRVVASSPTPQLEGLGISLKDSDRHANLEELVLGFRQIRRIEGSLPTKQCRECERMG